MKSLIHTAELLFAIPLGIVAAPLLLVVFALKALFPSRNSTNNIIRLPRTSTVRSKGEWTRHAV